MKIVLDTNVLVSGLLSPFSAPAEIVRMVSADMLKLCYDSRIVSEYREVLNRPKFQLDSAKIETFLVYIENNGFLVASGPLPSSLPDPDDEAFLEVAFHGQVEYLVTGNIKHFPAKKCQNVKITVPKDFLKQYSLSK